MSQETLIEFPAEIAVKAMGTHADDFEKLVVNLVGAHIELEQAKVTLLPSSGGKYLSVSVHFTAISLEQLHAVYASLRGEPRVLYTL